MQITWTQIVIVAGVVSATLGVAYQIAEFGIPAKSTDMKATQGDIKRMSKGLTTMKRRADHADAERREL